MEGTQPYKLPKLNADIRTGKYDTTPREAIHLLPYQTFDLIIPLPDRALVPHISAEPTRVTIIGQITPQVHRNRPPTDQPPPKSTPTQARREATRQALTPPPKPHLYRHSSCAKATEHPKRGAPPTNPRTAQPTIYFKINEPQDRQPNNSALPETKPTSPPQDIPTTAEGTPCQAPAIPEIQISDDEGGKEPQDVEMEPARQRPHNSNKRTETNATTMKEVLELQRLRPEAEQNTHAHAKGQQSAERQEQESHRQKQVDADPLRSTDPIQTSTPSNRGGTPHTEESRDNQRQKDPLAQPSTRSNAATPQHLHALYTGVCQVLQIPQQADNKQMQQLAAEVYQNINRYADHALAIVRVLTLAKWNPKQEIEAPLQQLLHQVANGWTLGAEQSNPAYTGVTQMGLAICLAHLAHPTHQNHEQAVLTSHYTDYIYKLRGLQHQHDTPLFLSMRRHCGHNRHAAQIVDPIMINTANNVTKHLQHGDLRAVLQPAQREYNNRHITNQCDKCYQPGTVRKEWKVTASQLIILQLQPSSGDQYLPAMRAPDQQHRDTRGKTAKLWGKKYALAGALLGVATDPAHHAETAFLQYLTQEDPNHYHIYQGTQRSNTITQENIPSWWVILALVLREEGADGGPNQNLAKTTKQHQPQQAKRGKQATKTSKKTIQKRESKQQRCPTQASATGHHTGHRQRPPGWQAQKATNNLPNRRP